MVRSFDTTISPCQQLAQNIGVAVSLVPVSLPPSQMLANVHP
jgi:hypothetical protein